MTRGSTLGWAAVWLGLLAVVAACSVYGPADPSLDGWPLGAEVSCTPRGQGDPAHDIVGIAQ